MKLPYLLYSRTRARYTIGVAAVILDESERVLLVEHAYHPRFAWGLPGGWIDADEAPALAIQRELLEELQIEARATRIVHVAKTARNHLDLAYLCEARGPVGKLSHELLDYAWAHHHALPTLRGFHRRAIDSAFALRRADS